MIYLELPKRVLEKHKLELVELHKRCIKSYLVQRDVNYKIRRKFEQLYDLYIDEKNIYQYWNIPVNLFVQAIVKNTIGNYFKYTTPDVRKYRKKSVRRKIKA